MDKAISNIKSLDMQKYILITILCGWGLNLAWAQDLKADMANVSKTYAEMKSFQFKMHVSIYNSFTNKKPARVMNSEAYGHNNEYYYAFGDQISLITPKGSLVVNKDIKVLLYSKPKKGKSEPWEFDLKLPKQEDLNSNKTEITWVGEENGLKHYIVKSSKGSILQTDFYIDPSIWVIKKITYLYDPKVYTSNNKVEIDYYSVSLSQDTPDSFFSLETYLDFTDKNYPKPSKAYSAYTIQYQ